MKGNTLVALYDSVFIPALTAAETDARAELLDQEQLINVEQSMRDIIEDLGTRPAVPSKAASEKAASAADEEAPAPPALAPDCRVYCLPARAELLDGEQLANVEQSMRDIIEDLGTRPAVPSPAATEKAEAAADEEAPAPPTVALDCRV